MIITRYTASVGLIALSLVMFIYLSLYIEDQFIIARSYINASPNPSEYNENNESKHLDSTHEVLRTGNSYSSLPTKDTVGSSVSAKEDKERDEERSKIGDAIPETAAQVSSKTMKERLGTTVERENTAKRRLEKTDEHPETVEKLSETAKKPSGRTKESLAKDEADQEDPDPQEKENLGPQTEDEDVDPRMEEEELDSLVEEEEESDPKVAKTELDPQAVEEDTDPEAEKGLDKEAEEEALEIVDGRVIFKYRPPPGEQPKKRFPQAVVIGFAKCGTRALLSYIHVHPNVVTPPNEQHFYNLDENFNKGYSFYRSNMPLSYSDQLTIEKTPAYVENGRALKEMRRNFPDVKVICLVRDPVVRLLSDEAQKVANNPGRNVTGLFLDENGRIDSENFMIRTGMYHRALSQWLKVFPRKQILVLNGDELVDDPLTVVQRVETFLGLRPIFRAANFVFNTTRGFYCYKGFERSGRIRCMDVSKGRPHRQIPPDQEKMLYGLYRPHNQKLFQLLNQTFQWDK